MRILLATGCRGIEPFRSNLYGNVFPVQFLCDQLYKHLVELHNSCCRIFCSWILFVAGVLLFVAGVLLVVAGVHLDYWICSITIMILL